MSAALGMIERVALALQLADDNAKREAEGCANGLSEDVSDWGAHLARAAIEAMREPTDAMVLAADGAVEAWRKTLSRDEAFLRHYTPRPRKAHTFIASATPEEKHAIRYRAMIDAALAVAPLEASSRQVVQPIRDAVNPSLKEV